MVYRQLSALRELIREYGRRNEIPPFVATKLQAQIDKIYYAASDLTDKEISR